VFCKLWRWTLMRVPAAGGVSSTVTALEKDEIVAQLAAIPARWPHTALFRGQQRSGQWSHFTSTSQVPANGFWF